MKPEDPLDPIDQTIVDLLVEDGRMSVPALAERAGVSRATAYNRFDRLVDEGIITGFGARVHPQAVGLSVSALLQISVKQGEWPNVNRQLLDTEGVQWVGMAAGPFDFIALVRAKDLSHLRDVVLRELLLLDGIRSTQTSVLLDEARRPGAAFA